MLRRLHQIFSRIGLLILLTVLTTDSWSQTFKDGIRQGMVKVKFAKTVSATVSTMTVATQSNIVVTGMPGFDVKAKAVKASNMYRLFPYDARNEARLQKHGLHLWYVVEIDQATDPRTAALEFKKLREIEVAEIDREKSIAPYKAVEYKPSAAAFNVMPFNDPYLKDQWHYENTNQTGYGDADINLFKAWQTTTGANNIVVSVHDEGVDVKHDDLKANIWVNTDEVPNNGIDDDLNGYVDDINGFNFSKNKGLIDPQHHGTHVAGTIAAVNNNGKGISGIAGGNGNGNGVKIMSLQILGGGLIERSYVYAANNGAVISQNSWGYTTDGYFDQSVLDAINYFIAEAGNYEGSPMRGGLVIFAAGNSNLDGHWYPGRYESILSVASIGPEWKKAAYSNYGSWVDISAPGGDQINYPGINGVLSTIPGNKYAYMQGTSMACPHVSGIAALVLANRSKQLSAEELWTMMVTASVSIDDQNEDFVGKLGSGAIDASIAIRSDEKIAPDAITDVSVTGVAQEFANLAWTVPSDQDDNVPSAFNLYIHTSPITPANLVSATKILIRNEKPSGEQVTYEVSDLLGLTTYYFAVTSVDRWGNSSLLSNVATASTNTGPQIGVSTELLELNVDASVNTSASGTFDISNNREGILRWESIVRHREAMTAFNASALRYPQATGVTSGKGNVGRVASHHTVPIKATAAAASFEPIEKQLCYFPTNIVGETNTTLPNSAAGKFFVNEENGFNLTDVGMYLKHDPATGPVIVEIYKGQAPVKSSLLFAQEYTAPSKQEGWASIILDEQLYFGHGETFWIVFHVPADNLFPLGIGFEAFEAASSQCLISFNVGATWQPLEEALNDKQFAFVMSAGSYNEHLGTYVTLDPSSGDVNGNSQTTVSVMADASALVNGTYSANIVLNSNDATKTQTRIPLVVTVSGHQPNILHADVADFGAVFVGESKTLSLALENTGYGNFQDLSFSIAGSGFEIISSPWSIAARQSNEVTIKFTPTLPGNGNATLEFGNAEKTYRMSLFGVGAESSRIAISPEQQSINDITIGDEVAANITVENTGAYPLKYFIPGFDAKGISEDWPSTYHRYGYKQRSNRTTEGNPIAYEFQDISSSGTDITHEIISDRSYFEVDMGFTFPYYGKDMHKIYIAQKGFTTFDNSVRPLNVPVLNNSSSPKGYISLLGTVLSFVTEGKVYYKLEPDRLIIQYDNVTDNYSGYVTAQMVLHANGDIRFYYDDLSFDAMYLNVLIEDYDKQDGILINDISLSGDLYTGLALGFDYPGPNIITEVANASGILAPGTSANVQVKLSTATLAEGIVNRYVNIISNDPANKQKIALVELNIEHGGVADARVSDTEVAFGDVFQGASASQKFTIKNNGTAPVEIASMTFAGSAFTLTGNDEAIIKPGLIENYSIQMPTSSVGALEDILTISYADATTATITISGKVIDPPAITVDLTTLNSNVNYGETTSVPLTIENPGLADLRFTTVGKSWVYTESSQMADAYSYTVQKENTGGVYQWFDIRATGVQLPFATDVGDENQFWRTVTLPFDFTYFGKTYSKMKVGENGIVSFEDQPPVMEFSDSVPSEIYEGAYIMPYWAFAGFDTYSYSKEDVGIFYQSFDDRIIVTWSYLVSRFGGMGDPMSAQMILYKNGAMRFQYRAEEGQVDDISRNTLIGLQESMGKGIPISVKLNLDNGNGLAYNVLPSNEYVVVPGAAWSGNLVLDASHTYGGTYMAALQIRTNVPGSELLEKNVQLTINGIDELSTPAEIDFGNRIIAEEELMPVTYVEELEIVNTGTTPVDITWIESASGGGQSVSVQVYALIDGWFGPQWEWADVSYLFSPWNTSNPVFQLLPGDKLMTRATFAPATPGDVSDEFVFTTSAGEKRIVLKGTGLEAPVLQIANDAVNVSLNKSNDTATRTITFNNIEGKSPLDFHVSLQFDRGAAASSAGETFRTGAHALSPLQATQAAAHSDVTTLSAYNRTLKHTERTAPDNHVGTGGSAPFTVATRFNAGNRGFNVSHIESWFRAESFKTGDIEVEVRAGSSVADAVTLATATIPFERSGEDQTGGWVQLPLPTPVFIYPNEDFYVLVTYPFEIKFPQGLVRNEPNIPGRYMYSENGVWEDIQNEEGFMTAGWLMYAAELTEQTSSWLTVTSPVEGSVEGEGSSEITLEFNAALASPGDQFATVVIATNDPKRKQVSIPVKLHLNEAPVFTTVPEALEMFETDTLLLKIPVTDPEQNTLVASLDGNHTFAKSTFTSGVLTVMLTPAYGTAGTHTFNIVAEDEHGASVTSAFTLVVKHTNRPPQFIGATDKIAVVLAESLYEFNIGQYFSDPDNDTFTFEIQSSDRSVAEVFTASDGFLVKTKSANTASIKFKVVDGYGARIEKTLQLTINEKPVDPNQAPVYVGSAAGITVSASQATHEFKISDFFADPENDAITFTAASTDNGRGKVFGSADKFLLQVLEAGTFEIAFTVKDVKGAVLQKSIPVTVEVVLGVENPLTQGAKVFPNPAHKQINISLGADWTGEKHIALISVNGQTYNTQNTIENNLTLNVSDIEPGVYLLKIVSKDKTVNRRIIIY